MNITGNHITISQHQFDAVIFDLDGVITRTARVHAAAWKAMFDEFLKEQSLGSDKTYKPFDLETDYRSYVDGKPRYDGVQSFIDSRDISLPYGKPEDEPGQKTICGLGNRKNQLFLDELKTSGVDIYQSTISLIRSLRQAGIKIAVVSSSRNCQAVLEAAGITDLFDARVDGADLQRMNLAGKPAPDMFLEACRRLRSEPQRSIGIEDAVAGVASAKAANLGWVIGVNRGGQADVLRAQGADIVVSDLAEIQIDANSDLPSAIKHLPSALECLSQIISRGNQSLAIFLDYDGTLTPIVSHPDKAILTQSMRSTLQRLAKLCDLAVISGRDLDDVRTRVDIEEIWYAGSHGFDIAGPAGKHMEYQEGTDYLPALDTIENALRERLASIEGCLVERKRFSIAIHYRQVAEEALATIKQIIEETHTAYRGLRLSSGKKIFELQPDIEWNKGKALNWLMETLNLDLSLVVPLYIGDDVTDEDAFREIQQKGIGILVAEERQPTCASYRLNDPDEVKQFLDRLIIELEGPQT